MAWTDVRPFSGGAGGEGVLNFIFNSSHIRVTRRQSSSHTHTENDTSGCQKKLAAAPTHATRETQHMQTKP